MGAGSARDGERLVQPSVNKAQAARMREAMAPSGRAQSVRLAPPQMGADFFREALAELRKVHWPTPEQARNLTALVIAVSLGVGLVLGAVDYIYAKIFQLILGT